MNTSIKFLYKNKNYILPFEELYKSWIQKALSIFEYKALELTFVFVSKETMKQYNRAYLEHDYDTDILTFDYSQAASVFSDVFISTDMAEENAKEYKTSLDQEIVRLIAHGILHIVGYKDQTILEKEKMTAMEDKLIQLFHVEQKLPQ